MGIGGGPSWLIASLGSLSYPFCLWQRDSWIDMGESHEACTASVCRGFPCASLRVKKKTTPFDLHKSPGQGWDWGIVPSEAQSMFTGGRVKASNKIVG